MPDAADDELAETYGRRGAAVVVYGHIHRPYVHSLPGLVVANSGSAGMAFDRDPRASYLLVEDGTPTVRRVEYDLEREVAALTAVGYPDAERLAEMRRSGRFIRPAP